MSNIYWNAHQMHESVLYYSLDGLVEFTIYNYWYYKWKRIFFKINSLPKLEIDGADFYAKLVQGYPESWYTPDEESQFIRWYTPTKELSNCIKRSIIDGSDRVECFWNSDNVSRNARSLFKESIRLKTT